MCSTFEKRPTDLKSINIIRPRSKTDYYEIRSTSTDLSQWQLCIFLHKYFLNIQIRIEYFKKRKLKIVFKNVKFVLGKPDPTYKEGSEDGKIKVEAQNKYFEVVLTLVFWRLCLNTYL